MTALVHLTDLHLERSPGNLDAALDLLGDAPADVILIGGDNGGVAGLERTVAALAGRFPGVPVGWIMGNHDLWRRPYTHLWDDFSHIPATYLETANLETEALTVVGTYGHYDYSGRDPSIPLVCYETYRCGKWLWNDHFIDNCGRRDPQIARDIAERFRLRYEQALDRGLPIVVLTHTSPFAPTDPLRRSFVSGYCANSFLGRILRGATRRPSVLFWGHTHRQSTTDDHGFPMVNPGSDYSVVRLARYELPAAAAKEAEAQRSRHGIQ